MTEALAALDSHYLTVTLGDDLYGIALGAVKDMRGTPSAEPLADVPAYVTGRAQTSEGPVPLVDLRRRLGLPARQGAGASVTVLLHRQGRRLGVIADAVAEVVDLGIPDEPAAAPAEADARAELAWLKGAAATGDRMVLMLDLDQLIAPADRASVDASMQACSDALPA